MMAAMLVRSGSNHSCSFTPGLLIALQLWMQLGNLAGPHHKMNHNQLYKDIWLQTVGEKAAEGLESIFPKRDLSGEAGPSL